MTTLEYNYETHCYEAYVDGLLVQVDADMYAENRQEMIKRCAEDGGLDPDNLSEEDYDRLYDAAEEELEGAEGWMNCDVLIEGEPAQEYYTAHPELFL